MKKFLLLITSFALTGTMTARQLTPDEALALALGKMNAAQPEHTRALTADNNATRASLTYTEMSSQDVPLYYVYDIAEGGFIIASADDRTSSLLGYTDSGDFDGAKQNLTFMAWLKDCRKALSRLSHMPEQTRSASADTRTLTTSVRPLLGEIKWNQNAPYNLLTPLRVGYPNAEAEPDTVHAPTGCAATAVAQVMMYYQWPATGTGSHTNLNDSTQTVDFSQSTYQWSKMLPVYQGGESEESRVAVAQLMRDVGCALNMDYGYAGSGAYNDEILKTLATYFSYDKSMRPVDRTMYSSDEWNDLLLTELNEKRPIIFRATEIATLIGHFFILDGYDTNGLYHVNWGWGGYCDGYYDMNLMDPINYGPSGYEGGYTFKQDAILGVKPDVEGTSVAKPELEMPQHFLFDAQTQQWTYCVLNHGLGDFTGEVGIAMESPTGEVTKLTTDKYTDKPIGFYQNFRYSFAPPAAPGPGYMLYPYYSEEVDGEMKRIPAAYNCFSTLYSVEEDSVYHWDYDETEVADIALDSVVVKHNFVGFDPQLNITLTNYATSLKEYAESIAVNIYTMVDDEKELVCSGYAQAFIMPGETKELIVRCNDVAEEFKGKIVEGEYTYYLYFVLGDSYFKVDSASFEMLIMPPSEITYSDFTINKTEFLPDEELTASMTVANAGGFDMKTLDLTIFRRSDLSFVDNIGFNFTDIDADSNETFTFKKAISFDPGEYIATFYVDGEQLKDAPDFEITVLDPTALDKVQSAPVNDGKSGIYDLQGRPVQQVHKGEMYIGKSKFMVK